MIALQSLRLRLDPTDIKTLIQHPLLSTPPKRRRIHLTRFDTPEQALAQLGISIDETRVLRKTTLTVRQAIAAKNAPEVLHEWSAPTTPGTFDFATLIDAPETAEQLSGFAGGLTPLFTIDAGQRQWSVQIRSAQVDVILEDGTLSTEINADNADNADNAQRSTQLCEVELRLNSGQPAALFGVARLLSRQVRLHPIRDSLMQRALAFSNEERRGPVKARRVRIDAKDSAVGVFKHVAWHSLDQLQANEDGVFTLDNVEFIHQARVALRRLRTALRLFNNELPVGYSDKWCQAWRDVGEQLGNARNWDVFCSDMLPAIAADLGDHPDVIHLKEFAQQKREEAHQQTQQWLHGRRYSLTLIAFCEALLTLPETKSNRIDSFADKALKKRHNCFCRGARVAHTLTGEERHEVRIDLKKLRYTLDFFESLYPQKQLQPFLHGLAETQELLGHMNDLVTGEMLLTLRPNNPFDLPVAWTKGKMTAYLEMLPSALQPVLNAKTPW